MANGSDSRQVSWWAYINIEGELEPSVAGVNNITIEVLAEDATLITPPDGWNNANPMISAVKPVQAAVVAKAPVFENERVFIGKSTDAAALDDSNWKGISSAHIKGRAAYRITGN